MDNSLSAATDVATIIGFIGVGYYVERIYEILKRKK